MTLYAVVTRFPHPAILSNDFARGIWYGVCLGVEVLGLYLFRRQGPRRAA